MKVDSSRSSYYSGSLFGQSSTGSDDDTPFMLPDGSDRKTAAASVSTASVGTSGIANSISSAFWRSQSASSSTEASAAATDGTDITDDSTAGDLSSDDILSEFAKWANMSPSDKIRAQYLEQQNLTEAQFSQLPTDQQTAINDQIADQIKQQLGTGNSGATDEDGDSAAVSLG